MVRGAGWAGVVLLTILAGGAPAAQAEDILDLPVTFSVINRNESRLACGDPDGEHYAVRGSLVAPAGALDHSGRAATLYLHGATVGEFQWHFREFRDRGYDVAWELARHGHISITIDQLGYGSSDRPDGNRLCTGVMADVANQVVRALRTGGYELDGGAGVAFGRVALAGQSWGALVAQIAVYSFGEVDAFINHGINNQPATIVHSLPLLGGHAASCARGGDDGSGYAHSWIDPELERYSAVWEIEKDVWEAVKARLQRDACGNSASNGEAFFGPEQQQGVGEIDVPALLIAGEYDLMVGPARATMEIQAARMISSPDVTLQIIPDQGHAGQFEVTKGILVQILDDWLTDHSL